MFTSPTYTLPLSSIFISLILFLIVVKFASTYVLTDFTLGYFVSDPPSAVTLTLLFTKISFVASAVIALVTSSPKLVVNVPSAVVALTISAAKFAAIVFSAAIALATSEGNPFELVLEFASI